MKKKKIIIAIVFAIVLILVLVFKKNRRVEEIAYDEVTPVRGDIALTILVTGVVQPENRLEIKPPIAGRIEELFVNEGQVVRKGHLLARMSSTERAALLDAARAKGEEEVRNWEELYRATPVLAPIDGTIILRNVEPGQTITNQDSVFVMSDRLTIMAQVDETDIAQIKTKQKAKVVLDAYPNQEIQASVGKIAFDAKTVNGVTAYVVDVLPVRAPAFMRSGMTANVTVFIDSKKDILLIPNEAIKTNEGRFYVLMGSANGKTPIERDIQIGITDGKQTEVVSGLMESDTLSVPDMKSVLGKASEVQTNPFAPMGRRRNRK